ncbi:uncharacterized protein LOC133925523 [Phragmites australis]|uniref:uncharacterized protein LOC133925523 n=1 Tax=Phragmites australis TaxID=29695 RepID=UPI002D7A1DA1|nr:uncharacterized protein LOC133925523 [Phragmites australis]
MRSWVHETEIPDFISLLLRLTLALRGVQVQRARRDRDGVWPGAAAPACNRCSIDGPAASRLGFLLRVGSGRGARPSSPAAVPRRHAQTFPGSPLAAFSKARENAPSLPVPAAPRTTRPPHAPRAAPERERDRVTSALVFSLPATQRNPSIHSLVAGCGRVHPAAREENPSKAKQPHERRPTPGRKFESNHARDVQHMNPPPQRGRSRYAGSAQGQQLPFIVDPTEAAGAAVRAFFPAHEGAGGEPSSSPAERAPPWQHQRYGGVGAEISLGHAHGQGHGMRRYHQFGVEGKQDHGGGTSSGSLPRQSSSPPGFFSRPVVDNGFPSARVGVGGGGEVHHAINIYKKTKSPVDLARQENITASNVVRSFSGGFSIGSWEDSNSIAFSNPTSKAGIHNKDDIMSTLSNYELQFGATKETGVDKYLQMQQDQVPFRVRAKRGCATHPRSIAERERRTRISEKLRKLQALVPNMDKQTSTADMLDLAVEHIRGLQSELQALKEEKAKCTCRGNHPSRN